MSETGRSEIRKNTIIAGIVFQMNRLLANPFRLSDKGGGTCMTLRQTSVKEEGKGI